MSIKELQTEWREHATRLRACCKRSAEYRSLGTRQELAATAREFDNFADALTPYLSLESQLAASVARGERMEAALRNLIAGGRVEACVNNIECNGRIKGCKFCYGLDFCVRAQAKKDLEGSRSAMEKTP